ncbi:unnamed protein product, partial [Owenia fusiformis]
DIHDTLLNKKVQKVWNKTRTQEESRNTQIQSKWNLCKSKIGKNTVLHTLSEHFSEDNAKESVNEDIRPDSEASSRESDVTLSRYGVKLSPESPFENEPNYTHTGVENRWRLPPVQSMKLKHTVNATGSDDEKSLDSLISLIQPEYDNTANERYMVGTKYTVKPVDSTRKLQTYGAFPKTNREYDSVEMKNESPLYDLPLNHRNYHNLETYSGAYKIDDSHQLTPYKNSYRKWMETLDQ